jgi:uncharacterized protein YbjT (DUF2867 family)
MPNTIFVSGATGTTGDATVRALLSRGANVIVGVRAASFGLMMPA